MPLNLNDLTELLPVGFNVTLFLNGLGHTKMAGSWVRVGPKPPSVPPHSNIEEQDS